mmetsp:Transcript_34779/g.72906  ORF Transcript_34779/g.72906 Transcript_34779/m.72906 type:complete len:239 (+) Transcript_34779:1749-2465(+)
MLSTALVVVVLGGFFEPPGQDGLEHFLRREIPQDDGELEHTDSLLLLLLFLPGLDVSRQDLQRPDVSGDRHGVQWRIELLQEHPLDLRPEDGLQSELRVLALPRDDRQVGGGAILLGKGRRLLAHGDPDHRVRQCHVQAVEVQEKQPVLLPVQREGEKSLVDSRHEHLVRVVVKAVVVEGRDGTHVQGFLVGQAAFAAILVAAAAVFGLGGRRNRFHQPLVEAGGHQLTDLFDAPLLR